jgi:hypothetical protein
MLSKAVIAIPLGIFALSCSPAHAAADALLVCTEKKVKATGKKAADLLKAFGKNTKKPNATKLAQDVSKAQSKFTKAFTKAETGTCQTSGDSAFIEAKVDAFVLDAIADLATSTTSSTTTTLTTSTTTTTLCNCCSGANLLSFEASLPAGNCGILRNFRCSGGDGDFANNACAADADCDLGPCIGATFCSGDLLISCTIDADCIGTCGEVTGGGVPVDLECGGWYQGGGSNSEAER